MAKEDSKCGTDKATAILRKDQPSGIGNRSNLRDWSDYAKGNSFDPKDSKAQSRHDLSADGCKADFRGNWSDDWKQPQRKSEGRGWQNPINKAAVPNTYTTDKGSKRGDLSRGFTRNIRGFVAVGCSLGK
jgi:hypothetical protein